MPRTIRFHLDENCATAIAHGLRRRGIDVTTTAEAALISATDEEQIAYALAEGRVVFTQDQDFLRINATDSPMPALSIAASTSVPLARSSAGWPRSGSLWSRSICETGSSTSELETGPAVANRQRRAGDATSSMISFYCGGGFKFFFLVFFATKVTPPPPEMLFFGVGDRPPPS